jgi:prepilin-type N-terminal cleavage/methylation domain-containing protein
MKSFTPVAKRCSTCHGFTLLEALVVIILLAILALVVLCIRFRESGFGESAARNRTVSAHASIQTGLEEYKEKFGAYPEPANPKEEDKFAGITLPIGEAHMLYQAITADGNSAILLASAPPGGASESDGKVSDEEMKNSITSTHLPRSVIYPSSIAVGTARPRLLVDGWGRPFQYTKGNPDPAKNKAMNPTYDLWSLRPKPGSIPPSDSLATKRDEKITRSWIKNW